MSGVRGVEGIRALSAFLRELGPSVLTAGAKAAAAALAEVARGQYAEGRGPGGKAWPLRKVDGAVALQRPTSEMVWKSGRGTITATVDDVVRHHRGRRPVFPWDERRLPSAWSSAVEGALRDVADRAYDEVMR